MLTGLWETPTRYRVTDIERGKTEVITILATPEEMGDFSHCLELEHMAREEVEQGWNREDADTRQPYSQDEKRDLGGTLGQLRTSRKYKRENNHGKFW